MSIQTRDIMGGLAKGLAVIESFSTDHPRLSIAEVSARTGLDRATARRCLLTLAHEGYADWDGKYFTLTPRVLRLGTACLASMPLPHLVQPVLDRLSESLGQSTSASILDGSEIVYIARAAQTKLMSIALMPGSRLPAFCTSMGRVLLAQLPRETLLERLQSTARLARTPHTRTELDPLLTAIDVVRAQGYAVIDEEVELGLQSLAVPLRDARGRVVGALNVGFARTLDPAEARAAQFLPALEQAAQDISTMIT